MVPRRMRIVFLGTPAFSVPTLGRILSEGHTVVAAYTRAPKPGGRRGLDLVKTPVHEAAEFSWNSDSHAGQSQRGHMN